MSAAALLRCLFVIALFVALAAAQQCSYTDEKTGRYWYFAYANNPTSDYEFPRNEGACK